MSEQASDEMLGVARKTVETELDDATRVRAVRGDADAARTLVELYQVRVFALVSRMLSGRGRATRSAASG